MISICFIVFLLISILTSSYGQVTCPSGWVQNGESCYLFRPYYHYGYTTGTWDQCNALCPAYYPGATMLCINNAAENELIRSQSGGWIWIGYTDMLPYGGGKGTKQYGWVTGCSSTYTNWPSGQPDNAYNIEDCAAVHGAEGGPWYDFSPQHTFPCGCQYNPALIRPTTAPSFRPTVAPSSGPTSSSTASPSFNSSVGDVSE
jgi:hypothetical protein